MDELEFNDSPVYAHSVGNAEEPISEEIGSEDCPSDAHFDDMKTTLVNHIKVM